MTKEFKCPPPFPPPDGWDFTGEIRPLHQGECGVALTSLEASPPYPLAWSIAASPSTCYYWVVVPSYPKSVDILGVTVTVEDVYGTMSPSIPKGWKVKSFSVLSKDDLGATVLHPSGALISTPETFSAHLPSKHSRGIVTAAPILILEKIA